MYQASKTLDTSSPFLHIALETLTHSAGSRVSGNLLLNYPASLNQGNLTITSSGTEYLSASPLSSSTSKYQNEIFHVSSQLQSWLDSSPMQQIFPFSFKLPHYAPASFSFSHTDSSGTLLAACITYTLKAVLTDNNSALLEDLLTLNVLSSKSRAKPQEIREILHLSTCCCFHKGTSKLALSQKDSQNTAYGQLARFHVEVNWEKFRGKIKEVIGSVNYKLQLNVPGGETYEFFQEIFDFNHSSSFLAKNESVVAINEFDVKVQGSFAENASSNSTALITSAYTAEAEVVFTFNFSEQSQKILLPVQINPHEVADPELVISGDWSPESQALTSIFLLNKTGQNIFSPAKSSLLQDSA